MAIFDIQLIDTWDTSSAKHVIRFIVRKRLHQIDCILCDTQISNIPHYLISIGLENCEPTHGSAICDRCSSAKEEIVFLREVAQKLCDLDIVPSGRIIDIHPESGKA